MSASVACIIYDESKKQILIAHRNPTGDMGNRWEFPGGKIDEGETPSVAIEREMMEEFSVKATVHQKITSTTFEHKGKLCTLDAFLVSVDHDGLEKPYVLTEHQGYKWINPEEVRNISFVDSDLKIYPEVMDFLKKNFSLES